MSGEIARLATVEARWFGDGPLAADLVAWFEAGGEVLVEPPRTDRYLRLPGVDGVGVKWRARRFEIKARREGTAARVVWQRRPAPLEAWLKWSAPLDPRGEDSVPPLDVAKARRLLTRYGVEFELAVLVVGGRRAWTFGLEGGQAGDVEAVLASAWADAAPGAVLAFAGGYPAWLDRLAAG